MTTDFRALCAEMAKELNEWDYRPQAKNLVARARAALAEPEPEGPTPQPVDGEVAELVTWLRARGQERETLHLPGAELSKQLRTAPFLLTRAADLLERVARRPKPPSLKEQALAVLDHTPKGWGLAEVDLDTIRRALESLPD